MLKNQYRVLCLKVLAVVVLVCAFNASQAQTSVSSKHLKIISAHEMKWSPGMVQQNSEPSGGKVFDVVVKIRKKGDYVFEKMITENQSLDMEAPKNMKGEENQGFKKCSKWQVVARSNRREVKDIADLDIKRVTTGREDVAAWIQYKYNGQSFITPVMAFDPNTELERVQ